MFTQVRSLKITTSKRWSRTAGHEHQQKQQTHNINGKIWKLSLHQKLWRLALHPKLWKYVERERSTGTQQCHPLIDGSLSTEFLWQSKSHPGAHWRTHKTIRIDTTRTWKRSWRWQQWKLLGWRAFCLVHWPCLGLLDFFNQARCRQVRQRHFDNIQFDFWPIISCKLLLIQSNSDFGRCKNESLFLIFFQRIIVRFVKMLLQYI